MDHLQRPELNKGTIDFIVGEDYWASHPPKGLTTPYFAIEPPHTGAKAPQPMNFLFAFDVSHEAVECGLLRTACTALLTVLYGVRTTDGDTIEPCFPPGSQVAILTFDRTIQFYNLSVRHCAWFKLAFTLSRPCALPWLGFDFWTMMQSG